MHTYSFEKLEVWKLAKDLSVFLYKITAKFPVEERFVLVSQIRRASVSIASNIAEGSSRISQKDQAYFYTIAFSSTIEVLNQLIICEELEFINQDQLVECRLKVEHITRALSKLKQSILNPKP
ncbi:four helix bundle protein [Hanamia caeni]|uniref:Four helix bundle protein n=1 Tax=Hanamia caeni TaxID=2294116 RepID=A0A3M9NN05_9BACT|nr:four helix bundle protein [Hanamia caeni]RNI38885.1 four helix bundle protein [Hanamia caeni]